jgi:GNAT superfamily N-acetyltransferase
MTAGDLVAFDEFTSVVDRTVAKIGSAAIAKSIRSGRIKKKFVAVTCHYDILEWLEPDWVLDMASCQLARGSLYQRPKIDLTIAPVHYSAWELFRRHHYLNTSIAAQAKCFAAFWNDEPVAFSAWIRRMSRATAGRKAMREHRTVVLPDFQGVGIGNRLSEWCAGVFRGVRTGAYSTTSHPGMIHYRNQSAKWKTRRFGMVSKPGRGGLQAGRQVSCGRVTGGFQYVGPPTPNAAEIMAALNRVRITGGDVNIVLDCLAKSAASKRSLLALTKLAAPRVETILNQLLKSGAIRQFKVGKRMVFELVDTPDDR